ncbi:MAG: ABC transporter permease [Rhodospirillales bacterium]|nr:ABC transporter permease [Rhodospirillales bacterium]MCW8862423.1 ABC transporter permease [Rhodospirillales bacterium]MCW8953116.1 ABC transporter permease [Rhodospirillales bacterium]MCW8969832.1 ABC transporter permease [Rhodospirillales bacterium]MCW9001581.1 ABC transporter permease [Rhodospirillales bacterium]
MHDESKQGGITHRLESIGRNTVKGIEEVGYAGSLFGESLFWLFAGPKYKQPVRIGSVFAQMMEVGVRAVPIVGVLAATVGVMLAIQGIYTLRIFGAETRVTLGIALSITREFASLITGILVAGRSGSALAARLGTMTINQEIDALKVMGINPVRFLVVPSLIAMLIMVPALTFFADLTGLLAAGLYVSADLDISLAAYFDDVIEALKVDDVMHGLAKSAIFAVLITLIGVANGATVKGGAEGVGRVTTRAVVQSIAAIIVTDMIFAFITTRH